LIIADLNATQIQNMKHLEEANEYARWSERDRASKLPTITEEQRQQIRQYLLLVQEHGFTKSFAATNGNEAFSGNSSNCPILATTAKQHPYTPRS
jgi:hypothetical protein